MIKISYIKLLILFDKNKILITIKNLQGISLMVGGFPDENQVMDLISRGEWGQVKLVKIFKKDKNFNFKKNCILRSD